MATYSDVQSDVRRRHGFVPKTCWIAHVRVLNGLPTRRAWNRAGAVRQEPCPPQKRAAIEETFRRLGIM
jgi:hypothetical protein